MATNQLLAQQPPRGSQPGGRFADSDPNTAWISPGKTVPAIASYELYPTPARGAGTQGSFMLYLPKAYSTARNTRFPVLYFLHGGNGNQRGAAWLMKTMDEAIAAGKMPPVIIVGVQALPIGWYVNANAGAPGVISGPVEDVLINDLIPYIDAHYRTIANAGGRGLEGWSMGGYGAVRLAYKYPDRFGYASSLAGALIDFRDEHNPQYLANTFGPVTGPDAARSIAFFDSVHPRVYASANAAAIRRHVKTRLVVGDQDWLYNNHGTYITKNFSDYLNALGISHTYTVLKGQGHMLPDTFEQDPASYPMQFWIDAFSR